MAPKKRAPKSTTSPITDERKLRLVRLVTLLADGPQSRDVLTKKLNVGVRDFYRDLKTLRDWGVIVTLRNKKYEFSHSAADAKSKVPFPDPQLTLGEAEILAKGRTAAHQRLREKIESILKPPSSGRSKRK